MATHKKIIFSFLLTLVNALSSFGQTYLQQYSRPLKRKIPEPQRPYFIYLNYSNNSFETDHNQLTYEFTLFGPGDTASIQNASLSEITAHSFDVTIGRDFISDRVGLSLFGIVGLLKGSQNGSNTLGTHHDEKLEGKKVGLGGQIFLNFITSGMAIRPYIGSQLLFSDIELQSKFSLGPALNPTDDYEINNDSTNRYLKNSVGARFVDMSNGLSFYLEANHSREINNSQSTSLTINGEKFNVISSDKINIDPISYGLGLGVNF